MFSMQLLSTLTLMQTTLMNMLNKYVVIKKNPVLLNTHKLPYDRTKHMITNKI